MTAKIVAVLALAVIAHLGATTYQVRGLCARLDDINEHTQQIMEDQKVYEITWQWKDANNRIHTIRVSDTNFEAFQSKVSTMKNVYPPNV